MGRSRLVATWLTGAALLLGSVALGTGLAAVSVVGPTVVAGADPIASCSTTAGVIVVADFSHWGGNAERGCASNPSTGYDALHAAGFTTTGDAEFGTAFVCRIDGMPSPTATPCTSTPPASAYWSFWYAEAGQNTWSYSSEGAESFRPQPGSVDVWTFGAGSAGGAGQPAYPPSAVRATNATPSGTTTTTTTSPPATSPTTAPGAVPAPATGPAVTTPVAPGTGPATTAPTVGGSARSATTTTTGPAAVGAGGGATTTAPSTTAPGAPGASAPSPTSAGGAGRKNHRGPRIVDVSPASARLKEPTGSPLPFVVGAVVVIVLVGAGGLIAWRRRRVG